MSSIIFGMTRAGKWASRSAHWDANRTPPDRGDRSLVLPRESMQALRARMRGIGELGVNRMTGKKLRHLLHDLIWD